jgi:hypothetical protein
MGCMMLSDHPAKSIGGLFGRQGCPSVIKHLPQHANGVWVVGG